MFMHTHEDNKFVFHAFVNSFVHSIIFPKDNVFFCMKCVNKQVNQLLKKLFKTKLIFFHLLLKNVFYHFFFLWKGGHNLVHRHLHWFWEGFLLVMTKMLIWHRSKQVRTLTRLLRSLSDKKTWERHELPYSHRYKLNSTANVILQEWLWYQMTQKGWCAIKRKSKPNQCDMPWH